MDETRYVVIFISSASHEEAEHIVRTLLEKRRIACASIVPHVNSSFWWQGKIDSVDENLIIAKTRADKMDDVIRISKELHSYQIPEIIALPIVGGNPDYFGWIEGEVG